MVTRGARNLILLSRNGSKAAPAGFLETLRDMGVHVETPPCDVSDKSSLESALIYVGQNMPAIKGCIHAAAVINVSLSIPPRQSYIWADENGRT